MEVIDFWEFSQRIIIERIEKMNELCSYTRNIFKISKIFILTDFITSIQNELLKNKDKIFKFEDDKKLKKNFEVPFYYPSFNFSETQIILKNPLDDSRSKSSRKISKNETETEESKKNQFYSTPVVILYRNHKIISEMFSMMSFKQKKPFLRLHGMMKRCSEYDQSSISKSKVHSYRDYLKSFRNGMIVLIAFDSFLTNPEILNSIRFVAFQFNLTSNSVWKCWEDVFNHCSEKSFGFVLNTIENYSMFKNNSRPDKKDIPEIIEDFNLSFDHFQSFLMELSKTF